MNALEYAIGRNVPYPDFRCLAFSVFFILRSNKFWSELIHFEQRNFDLVKYEDL